METDKVENIEEVSTLEGVRCCEETATSLTKKFEECRERRSRNRTEKGLQFDTANFVEGPPMAYEHYL